MPRTPNASRDTAAGAATVSKSTPPPSFQACATASRDYPHPVARSPDSHQMNNSVEINERALKKGFGKK